MNLSGVILLFGFPSVACIHIIIVVPITLFKMFISLISHVHTCINPYIYKSAYCTKPVLCNKSLMHKTLPFHFLSFSILLHPWDGIISDTVKQTAGLKSLGVLRGPKLCPKLCPKLSIHRAPRTNLISYKLCGYLHRKRCRQQRYHDDWEQTTTFEILCKCILKAHENMDIPRGEKKVNICEKFSCVELLELYELLFVALIVPMLRSWFLSDTMT